MAKTITMTDLRIKQIEIDYELNRIVVKYDLVDPSGKAWDTGIAFFWVTLPVMPPGIPQPVENFQLPASYIPVLLQLKNDADSALTPIFLV